MALISIVGNSGAARECYWILRDLQTSAPGLDRYYRFNGFFDWKGYAGDLQELEPLHKGSLDDHVPAPDELFVIGVGKPELRRDIFFELKSRGAQLMNLVHPWSSVNETVVMGEGNIFQRGCTIFCNAVIGNGNYINGAANMAHDTSLGDFNFLGPHAILLGHSHIGSCNYVGTRCTLLEYAGMGNGNMLAPGSILYKGCKDNTRMAGNPALRLGNVSVLSP